MACVCCGDPTTDNPELCDTCELAAFRGFSIEEARFEVEDGAAFWTKHLGRAEGKRCECSAKGLEVAHAVENVRGTRGRSVKRIGVIHYDVPHEPGCPLAPPAFDWPEVDEAGRRRVFGYEGRAHHLGRLVVGLRELAADRAWEL